MSKKKAFVRYAGNKAVPGSLIVRTKAPKVGTWKEVPYDVCCGGGTFTTTIEFPENPEFPGVISDVGFGFIVRCNGNNVISYFVEYPLGTNTTQEVVDYLNPILVGVASFSVIDYTTIAVSFSQIIADALCPSGILTVQPNVAV